MAALLNIICIFCAWILVSEGTGVPFVTELELASEVNTPRFLQNPVGGSCKCRGTSCGCCQKVSILHVSKEVCINVKYLKKEIGVLLTVTWDGKTVFSKEVSAENPPPICLKVPLLGKLAKLCVQLYKMHVGKDGLSGCSRITVKVVFVKVLKFDLGCFNIPFAEDETMAGAVPWNKQALKTLEMTDVSSVSELKPLSGDDTLSFIQNSVGGSCKCGGTSCGCCQKVSILHVSKEVCINVKYLKKEIGVLLTVTWGGKTVFSKEVSVENPPPVCLKVPVLKKAAKLCVQLYNMHVGKDSLSGCSRITIKVALVKVLKFDLGCFNIPFAEDENMVEGALWNKPAQPNYEHKPLMVYLRHMIKNGHDDGSEEIAAVLMQAILKEDSFY
ncbi:uncharacterized protein LOC130046357 isoform X2 [Ostrea edulis]|uniref:uncharacterized protein LOC130046357 isoform X2 n=1 Tax=Ostrea edulis TaxID=37623 RepID=UPI0024AFD9E2|nr:uncharacterized protein LOC130046357 isoform X2 [Ostrea edulis]